MLSKVNKELDESSYSFADLPSELTITEDNRAAIDHDFRFNMATFEASKKLMGEAETIGLAETKLEDNSLLRKLEIFEGEVNQLRHLHTVTCVGFNAGAPKLVYSSDPAKNRAILDKGSDSAE